MTSKFARVAAYSALMMLASGAVMAEDMPTKGVTPYVTHSCFGR